MYNTIYSTKCKWIICKNRVIILVVIKMIVSQIIGMFAVILWVLSIQNKEKKNILLFQIIANLLYSLQYFIIHAFSASLTDFFGIIKSLIFYNYTKNNKNIPIYMFFVICLIYIVLGTFTYNGLVSLIPIFISCLYTYGAYKKDEKYIRITVLIGAFFWIYYNVYVGAYVAILGNVLEIISSITSLIRFRNHYEKSD